MNWAGLIIFVFFVLTPRISYSKPTQCKEVKECLNYDIVCETPDYEVRHYNASKWVATNITSLLMEFAGYQGFTRLYQYIQGKNVEGKRIDMTAPVLLKIPQNEGTVEFKNYIIHFLIPVNYQQSPPAPIDTNIYFIDFPDMYAYVKSFGGWLLTLNSKFYASKLKQQLNNAAERYDSSYYYGAGYNSPKTLVDRHNEVWYIADGAPVCSAQAP
ncbi:heme-binding protein 2-like [Carcharodon carcharias]|uniref:heme-binding protein 2-like n=1 Tax=Carcharodon carcharias TaxID=13397 RepID=UPI001B7F5351|nr:heme-binding protein 2-like [Carcharodon carcharias]XP_041032865.1 heme-binding protein 2-like [Carcharodon carcharias]